MGKFQGLRTVDVIGNKIHDPCKHLWRSVLVIAIEDAIKDQITRCRYKRFFDGSYSSEISYVTKPNQDFATVCHYADLDHNLVRSKIKKVLKNIEENYGKSNMPQMPWQRLFKNAGVEKKIPAGSETMQPLSVTR